MSTYMYIQEARNRFQLQYPVQIDIRMNITSGRCGSHVRFADSDSLYTYSVPSFVYECI